MAQHLKARQRAFLAAYQTLCRVDLAAKAAKIERTSHYYWLKKDKQYAQDFEAAREMTAQQLEDEAIRRAYEGTEKPVTVAGEREVIREYSDTLLIFLLKGARPDKYRERATFEHTGKDGRELFNLEAIRDYMKAAPEDGEPK